MNACVCSLAEPLTKVNAASASLSSGTAPGVLSGQPADPMAFRRLFRDRWGAFLRAHFHGHLHVAVFFGVDEKTARQWWNDVNTPQGWAVAYACEVIPGAAAVLAVAA